MRRRNKRRGIWIALSADLPMSELALEASDSAFKLWVVGLCLARQAETTGHIAPTSTSRLAGASEEAVKELVELGAWHRHGEGCGACPEPPPGHVQIHAYARWQDTPDEIEERRQQATAAAVARYEQRDKQPRSMLTAASREPSEHAHSMPTASGRQSSEHAEVEVEVEVEETPSPQAADAARGQEIRRDDVERLCSQLADRVEANVGRRPNVTDGWRTAARLLIDRDGRTEAQVAWMIDWATADEFWRTNVLAMPTLRKQFDKLLLRARPDLVVAAHDPSDYAPDDWRG